MYTSRLPVSTSVRRPTRDADSSRTSNMLNRVSNIPVTVRKANLFTPQTKRPFSMGASTAGKSYIGSMTTEKKYQRPLKPMPDRDLQMKMFDTLVEYIQMNAPNLPVPEAKKFFSSVSTTESTRIFELLISRLIPDFRITRLETDVPEALSTLEYPYIRSVTKSALVSVTTRQAAVGLLVIFNWLIGCSKCSESQDDNENAEKLDLRAKLALNTYQESDPANPQLFDDLEPLEDLESLDRQYDDVATEIEDIKAYIFDCEDIAQETQTIIEDNSKCRDYNIEMKKYCDFKKNEYDEVKRQYMTDDLLFEELLARRERSSREFDAKSQEVSLEDVRQIQIKFEDVMRRDPALTEQINLAHHEVKTVKTTFENEFNNMLATYTEKLEHREKILNRELEVVAVQGREKLAELEVQEAEMTRNLASGREQSERTKSSLKEEEDEKVQRRQRIEANSLRTRKLECEHLNKVLDDYMQKAFKMAEAVQEDTRHWEEALSIAEENKRILRKEKLKVAKRR